MRSNYFDTFTLETCELVSIIEAADAVWNSVLPGIEVSSFRSSLVLLFFSSKEISLLLLRQFLAVNTLMLGFDFLQHILVLFLLLSSERRILLFYRGRRLLIVFGSCKVHFDISLDAANLVVRLGVDDVNQVVVASILNRNGVSLEQTGVMRQFLFETTR